MANKHMKKCSSLVIREMQTKTTMRYYFTSTRLSIIKKAENNNCWQGCGGLGTFVFYWWALKMIVTVKNSTAVPQNVKRKSSIRPTNSTPRCIVKKIKKPMSTQEPVHESS